MKNNQVGGVVSFVIVAIALAGLLGGGLYLSKQMGREARESGGPAPQIAAPQTTNNEKKNEEKPVADSAEQGSVTPERSRDEAPKPAAPAAPATPAQPTTPQASNDRVAVTGPSDELPATGPTETATLIAVTSVLVFTIYRLYLSRKSFLHSALHR